MLDVVEQRRLHLDVAAARFSRRRRSSSLFQITIPFGCQNGEPGEWSERWNRSSCDAEPAVVALPRLLEPLEMRVEVGLRVERRAVDPRQLRFVESPRQYAPARPVSLSALIGFEFWRCGPRQRSVKSPCV